MECRRAALPLWLTDTSQQNRRAATSKWSFHGRTLLLFFLRKPGFHSFIIFGDYSPKCKDTLKRNRKYIPVLVHS
jgi:hypothetical protein